MSDKEIVVGDVIFRELEDGNIAISIPKICNPESQDVKKRQELIDMIARQQDKQTGYIFLCDP